MAYGWGIAISFNNAGLLHLPMQEYTAKLIDTLVNIRMDGMTQRKKALCVPKNKTSFCCQCLFVYF